MNFKGLDNAIRTRIESNIPSIRFVGFWADDMLAAKEYIPKREIVCLISQGDVEFQSKSIPAAHYKVSVPYQLTLYHTAYDPDPDRFKDVKHGTNDVVGMDKLLDDLCKLFGSATLEVDGLLWICTLGAIATLEWVEGSYVKSLFVLFECEKSY